MPKVQHVLFLCSANRMRRPDLAGSRYDGLSSQHKPRAASTGNPEKTFSGHSEIKRRTALPHFIGN